MTRLQPHFDNVLVNALSYLVDERVGIIQSVREVRRMPGAPNFYHFAAEACNTAAFTRQLNFNISGGAATDRYRAAFKAVGEGIERYCSAIYDVEELPLSTAAEAGYASVPPSDFALYSGEQYESQGFPWVPFLPDTPIRWTAARDVLDDSTWHVPAAMVYMPYSFYQGTGDSPIVQPISTGMACHGSFARAALSGVYEVIERDAFTITWQGRLSPPQVRVETLTDDAYELVHRFEVTGASVVLLDLTLEHGVPTILSVLRSPHGDAPALVFAAASSLNSGEAVQSALEELAHTRRYSQQIKSHMEPLALDADFSVVTDQVDHLNVYCDHANSPLADFLFTSKKRVEFEDLPNLSTGDSKRDLETVARKVRAVGHRVLVADMTSDDVGSLGLHVVRAIIPGFHPLFMGHRLRSLGGRRLWEIPKKLGYRGVDRTTGDNPAPHPYP